MYVCVYNGIGPMADDKFVYMLIMTFFSLFFGLFCLF